MALSCSALRVLVAVIDSGSFVKAGKALGYSASAVSQQVASLERATGLTLFLRSARSVKPTHDALLVYERANRILGQLDRLATDAKRIARGEAGSIRIGSFASAGAQVLAPSAGRFMREYPSVDLNLTEDEPEPLLKQLLDGQIDLAIIFRYDLVPFALPDHIKQEFLFTEPQLIIAPKSHELARRMDVRLASLGDENWIVCQPDTFASRSLVARLGAEGIAPRIVFRSNNFHATRGLVREGLGISMIPMLGYAPDPLVARLAVVDQLPSRHVLVVWRDGEDNLLSRQYREILRETAESYVTGANSYSDE